MSLVSYQSILKRACEQLVLPSPIVYAIIERESGWNPWTVRFSAGAYETLRAAPIRFQSPCDAVTEAMSQSTAWGLMQVMGRDARARGFDGPLLSVLAQPVEGIIWGCRHLAHLVRRYSGDLESAVAAYGYGTAVLRDDLTWTNQSYVDGIARIVRDMGELPFWEPRPPRFDIRSGDAR